MVRYWVTAFAVTQSPTTHHSNPAIRLTAPLPFCLDWPSHPSGVVSDDHPRPPQHDRHVLPTLASAHASTSW